MEMLSREELNTQAHLLAVRVESLSNRGRGLGVELRRLCDQVKESIVKVKLENSELPELPKFEDKDSAAYQTSQQRLLAAERDLWITQQPHVLSKNESVIEAITLQKLKDNVDGLTRALSVLKEERIAVGKELDRERKLLEESQQIEKALKEKLATMLREQLAESSGKQVENLLSKGQQSCDILSERMEWFVDNYLPDGHNTGKQMKRKKGSSSQTFLDSFVHRTPAQDFPDLYQVIQTLISKSLENKKDSYVSVKTIWPPHFQLLLQSDIVRRHSENHELICITPFHR